FGAHFPYDDKYPVEDARFPMIGGDDRERLISSYKNAVAWSVDEFFRVLLPATDLSNTLIIYTSDHGQNLLDNGYKVTHCSTDGHIARGEGLVPLFAITLKSDWVKRLNDSAQRGASQFSHFEIFPTLLSAFGYDEQATEAKYGPSLL